MDEQWLSVMRFVKHGIAKAKLSLPEFLCPPPTLPSSISFSISESSSDLNSIAKQIQMSEDIKAVLQFKAKSLIYNLKRKLKYDDMVSF